MSILHLLGSLMERTYLNDSRTGSDGLIGDALVAASKHNVGLTSESLRNLNREATVDDLCLDECGASDSNESSIDLGALRSLESVVLTSISKPRIDS